MTDKIKKTFMLDTAFQTKRAYSHAVVTDMGSTNMIFIAGQIAKNIEGEIISTDVEEQAVFIFEKIKRILEQNDATLEDLVKVQIFLTNIDDMEKVSSIRNEYLKTSKPVSTLVEMGRAKHKEVKIEIDGIAVVKK